MQTKKLAELEFLTIYLRIAPCRIHFLLFILQGYDGLATITTLSPQEGLVVVKFSETVQNDLFILLNKMASTLIVLPKKPINKQEKIN